MTDSRHFDTSVQPISSSPLRVTSTELLHLLDISPDALLIVDHEGTIVMANAQAAALFGYRHEEVYELRLEMLLPQRLHSMHVAHRQHYFAAPRTRAMGAELQLWGQHKDGTEFPVDISLRPVLLGDELLTIGAIRDMSLQRRAESERAQQAEHLQLQAELIDLSHDAILIRDSVSRVIFWNKGAEELYGWSSQEALGRLSHSLLKTRFPTSLADVDAHLERDGHWEGELTHTRRDGSLVVVESRQVLVCDVLGHAITILEINRDITERRRLEHAAQAVHDETVARLTFLQQILDALPSSIYLVYSADARLLLANRAATSVWGAEWHIDQPMLEFLATNGIKIFDTQGRSLARHGFCHAACGARGRDGPAPAGDHPSSQWIERAGAGQCHRARLLPGMACRETANGATRTAHPACGDRATCAGPPPGCERAQGSGVPQRRVYRRGCP